MHECAYKVTTHFESFILYSVEFYYFKSSSIIIRYKFHFILSIPIYSVLKLNSRFRFDKPKGPLGF